MLNALNRRSFLQASACAVAGLGAARSIAADDKPAGKGQPTKFQVGCMTLPYQGFPLQRALTGLQSSGYRYVCLYTTHRENGKPTKVLPLDAPPDRAKELAQRCRDMGLEPVMMFADLPPENVKGLTDRLKQLGPARIGQLLVMGNTRGNDAELWIKNFKVLGPIARDQGVTIVAKQHGGNTGTGEALAKIIGAVDDEGVKISYDAGNVMDYHKIDPLPDIRKCADQVRSFCIKDHRLTPKDQDCGPGFGEIDHYKLLAPVAFTGRAMPLCFENIFAPVVPRPKDADGIDALARRAREFLELVVAGVQAA
jgi:sugar phosphate isomerase/epimerase